MPLVAKIDGKPVYSNKDGPAEVIGTRVSFPDGSWCDTASREIKNNGPGFVTFGDDNSPAELRHSTDGSMPSTKSR